MANPFEVAACAMSLDDLELFKWVDKERDGVRDGIPQIDEVTFDGEPLDPGSDEDDGDVELFECFVAQHAAWKKLMSGFRSTAPAPKARTDGGVEAESVDPQPDAGVNDAGATMAPAARKHKGATVEYSNASKIPDKVRKYIDEHFSKEGWTPADRVKVTTVAFDEGKTIGLSVKIKRGEHSGLGYARCADKPSCARAVVNNAIEDLLQNEVSPDKPAAAK